MPHYCHLQPFTSRRHPRGPCQHQAHLQREGQPGNGNKSNAMLPQKPQNKWTKWVHPFRGHITPVLLYGSALEEKVIEIRLKFVQLKQIRKLKMKSKLWSSSAKIQGRSRRTNDTCKQKNRTIVSKTYTKQKPETENRKEVEGWIFPPQNHTLIHYYKHITLLYSIHAKKDFFMTRSRNNWEKRYIEFFNWVSN